MVKKDITVKDVNISLFNLDRIGFAGGLSILFVALKLLDKIDWPWFWCFSPILIVVMFKLIIFLIVMIAILFACRD